MVRSRGGKARRGRSASTRVSIAGTSDTCESSPPSSSSATRRASKRGSSTQVVASQAVRSRIDRPPTWCVGRQHSHRSSKWCPRRAAEPIAENTSCATVSRTGRGSPVVPEVRTATRTSSSGQSRSGSGAAAAAAALSSAASTRAAAPWRATASAIAGSAAVASMGATTAPSRPMAWNATAHASSGVPTSASVSPGR